MKDLEFTKNEKAEWIYDVIAGIMAIIAVLIVMMEFSEGLTEKESYYIHYIDNIIYIIFVIDYFGRLILSKNKINFFISNIVDLIAILPFGFLFSFKYGSALKLVRVITYFLRLIGDIKEVMFTNNLIYALGVTIIIIFLASIGVYIFEADKNAGISSYEDALWWSIVTVSTVGYGDVIVVTRIGRIIGCILILTGVGFLGMFTSTMSSFFFNKYAQNKMIKKDVVEGLEQLDISDFSEEDKKSIKSYYDYLNSKNSE